MKVAARVEAFFKDTSGAPHYRGLTHPSKSGPVWTGKIALAPDENLLKPLHWRRGRKIFVNSEGDLFHELISDSWIDKVFAIMALCPQHTFQVLTKRADRMRNYLGGDRFAEGHASERIGYEAMEILDSQKRMRADAGMIAAALIHGPTPPIEEVLYPRPEIWPLPNVWLGVSAERQKEADERIPELLATPAAIRFVSAEPLLGSLDLSNYFVETAHDNWDWYLDWVIAGGESGHKARPMHPDWTRALRDQCRDANIPFFFKQWGEWAPVNAINTSRIHALLENTIDAPRIEKHWPADLEFFQKSKGVPGRAVLGKVGKSNAGHTLDEKEYREFPRISAKERAA